MNKKYLVVTVTMNRKTLTVKMAINEKYLNVTVPMNNNDNKLELIQTRLSPIQVSSNSELVEIRCLN